MSEDIKLPGHNVLNHVFKLSIKDDRPIMTDYWQESLNKNCFIGVRESGEKLLVKDEEQYTSPIGQIYKVSDEYIILTANSIYIVSADIGSRKIE